MGPLMQVHRLAARLTSHVQPKLRRMAPIHNRSASQAASANSMGKKTARTLILLGSSTALLILT
jgi:hypothetical protein